MPFVANAEKLKHCRFGSHIRQKSNMTTNAIKLQEWLEKNNTLPVCINAGCSKPVAIRHWTTQGDPSCKTECSRCCDARKRNKTIDGVTIHKKKFCENITGVLGFVCPIDASRYAEFPSDIYHMDHLDGNHHNNDTHNLMTFCAICHTRKGKENGDFNGYKNSSRIHKQA